MRARSDSFQFIRMKGFERGSPAQRGTLGAIVAEGLRRSSHISHLRRAPCFEVVHLDGPVHDPNDLSSWIEEQMELARNPMRINGKTVMRSVRRDATAIGTIIASLPETMDEFDQVRFSTFAEDTTQWVRDFLSEYGFRLHFRLEHLDEEHPHIHLWFTPEGVDQGDGSWSFGSVIGRNKGFLHRFQESYFEAVMCEYSEFRARPLAKRNKRVPRHFAVQQRDERASNLFYRLCEGDISVFREKTINKTPSQVVGSLLNALDDEEVDNLPAIKSRFLEMRKAIEDGEKEKKELVSLVSRLEEKNDSYASMLEGALANKHSGAGEYADLLNENKDFKIGANRFLSEGVWGKIVNTVLESAVRNEHHLSRVSSCEWKLVVLDDAISDISVAATGKGVKDLGYWMRKVVEGFVHYEKNKSWKEFEAFRVTGVGTDRGLEDEVVKNEIRMGQGEIKGGPDF